MLFREMSSGCNSMYKSMHPPSDALGCVICLDEVASDPWQHDKCGKLFCRECLKRVGEKYPCPNCREYQPRYFEDTRGKRLLATVEQGTGAEKGILRQNFPSHTYFSSKLSQSWAAGRFVFECNGFAPD